MLFEVNNERTDSYIVRNFELTGIPSTAFKEKLDRVGVTKVNYDISTGVSVILFEDDTRFDLGISISDDEIIWVCTNFTVPNTVLGSDTDFIYGMIYGWIFS